MENGSLKKVIDIFHDLNEHEKNEKKTLNGLASAVGMLKKNSKKHEAAEVKEEKEEM